MRAPRGYTNLSVNVGPFPLYYHTKSGKVALLIGSPLDKTEASESDFRKFDTQEEAKAWVQRGFEQAPVQTVFVAYSHNPGSTARIEVKWDAFEQVWYGLHDGRYSGSRYHTQNLYAPDDEWGEKAAVICSEIDRLNAELEAQRLLWESHVEAGIHATPEQAVVHE